MMKSTFNMCGAIALCNIIDGFMTHIGLTNQLIEEFNPLMRLIWELDGGIIFILWKLFLSLCIFLVGLRLQHGNKAISRGVRVLVSSALLLYMYILCIHAVWVIQAFVS